jgi:hypothetical protein
LNLIHSCLKRLVGTYVSVLRTRCVHWTKPLTSSLPLGTLADLTRSKAELMAENALLRQQLLILKRQVKRPTCTKRDRILLVLLARAVRTWKQTLFLVQPDTSISTPAERLEPVLTWIGEQRDAALADLQRFCRQPSISAQGQGMREMAHLVVESLHELGAETSLVPTQGFPVVVGRLAGESTRRLAIYDH